MRLPQELDLLINNHKALHGADLLLISVNELWYKTHKAYFRGKVHILCCNKGMLYRGIPLIITMAKQTEDFLLAY